MAEDDYIPNFIGMSWFESNNQVLPSLDQLINGILAFQDYELEISYDKAKKK